MSGWLEFEIYLNCYRLECLGGLGPNGPFKRFGHNWAFQALSKRNTSDGFDPCMPL